MVSWYLVLLLLVGGERLVELAISRRNAARALARGGIEAGQRHFLFMKVLHTGFLIACAAEVLLLRRPFVAALGVPMLALALASQALRYWAVLTLGGSWNVRVIVVPGDLAVTAGPYRYLRHPNYVAVIAEGVALPLVHTAYLTAVGFTLLNAALLTVRIRCEERALREHCAYEERLGDRPRLVPGRRAWTARTAPLRGRRSPASG
jgi:methyltransferase